MNGRGVPCAEEHLLHMANVGLQLMDDDSHRLHVKRGQRRKLGAWWWDAVQTPCD